MRDDTMTPPSPRISVLPLQDRRAPSGGASRLAGSRERAPSPFAPFQAPHWPGARMTPRRHRAPPSIADQIAALNAALREPARPARAAPLPAAEALVMSTLPALNPPANQITAPEHA